MAPQAIDSVMRGIGAQEQESVTLNRALGKLRAWTESQMNGKLSSNRRPLTGM